MFGESGYAAMPLFEEMLAGYLSPTAVSFMNRLSLPLRPCRFTSRLVGNAYEAAGQADASLHTMVTCWRIWILVRELTWSQSKNSDEPQIWLSVPPSRLSSFGQPKYGSQTLYLFWKALLWRFRPGGTFSPRLGAHYFIPGLRYGNCVSGP